LSYSFLHNDYSKIAIIAIAMTEYNALAEDTGAVVGGRGEITGGSFLPGWFGSRMAVTIPPAGTSPIEPESPIP